jgi:hypothetical protein
MGNEYSLGIFYIRLLLLKDHQDTHLARKSHIYFITCWQFLCYISCIL